MAVYVIGCEGSRPGRTLASVTAAAQAVRGIVAAAVLLASQAGDASCGVTPKACGPQYHGLHVLNDRVVDSVTITCDPRPVRHYTEVWLEYKPFDSYASYGRHVHTNDRPDAEGFTLAVSSPCLRGWYRTKVYTEGWGPATETNPDGLPFEYEETGTPRHFTADNCGGR